MALFGNSTGGMLGGNSNFANLPFWKIALASGLSNLGRPGTGFNPIQLVMAQQQAQERQQEKQAQTQLFGQLGQMAGPRSMSQQAFGPTRSQVAQTAFQAGSPELAMKISGVDRMFAGPKAPIKLGPNEQLLDPNTYQQLAKGAGDSFKVGQTREIQMGPNNVTQEWDGQQWKTIGQGPAFAPQQQPAPFNPSDPKVLRDQEDAFRAEFKPATQELQQTQSSYKVLKDLLKQGTPLSVTYAIKQLERAFEPGSIVRPQDIDAINNAQGIIQELNSNIEKYRTGIPASDPLRKQIEQAADSLLASKQSAYNDYIRTYEPVLNERGVKIKNVAPLLTLPGPSKQQDDPSSPNYDWAGSVLGSGWTYKGTR